MKTSSRPDQTSLKTLLGTGLLLLLSFLLLVFSIRVYAWFYYGRNIVSVGEITDPTAIFINAGNREDIRYLDLGGIDVETSDGYKDFVFCVRGNNVLAYKIQLAYTTNNQFDYEIYRASAASDLSSVPSSVLGLVVYDLHDGSGSSRYYYAPSGASPLPGAFLNLDSSSDEKIAKNSDTYHNDTYTPSGGSVYLNRHRYAIPLYWQTSGNINPVNDEHYNFCDYYILRVKWQENSKNDKETDIVYISAKNVAV